MKISSILVALTLIVFDVGSFAQSGPGLSEKKDEDQQVMDFKTMFAVAGPFTGAANPIRGINGGGTPWQLDSAKGELNAAGELEVKVRGLVIVSSGVNPVPFFRAVVSCISVDSQGAPITANVPTTNGAEVMSGDPRDGNAKIEETISLPNPCIAPIIFVTTPGGAWLASTGSGAIPTASSSAITAK